MFGTAAFSEVGFSETTDVESLFLGSLPIIYFNSSTLTFPLRLNLQADFPLSINSASEFSLNINQNADFPLSINTIHNYNLAVNKIINFDTRR